MMSVETRLARARLAVGLDDDRDLAQRVLTLGDGADLEVAQLRLHAGGGVDRVEYRVDRAVSGEGALLARAVGRVTADRACGGRREEASTSNHSSV